MDGASWSAADDAEAERRVPLSDEDGQFLLDLDGYDGPLDALLDMARAQKVDLARLSILALADQYLAFVQRQRQLRIELAADYLVMAAWLIYLKSRLLLPPAADEAPEDILPDPEALAAALALQLRRLDALRQASVHLMARPRLGVDLFARGGRPALPRSDVVLDEVDSGALADAMRQVAERQARRRWRTTRVAVHAAAAVLPRLRALATTLFDWADLQTVAARLFPGAARTPILGRSALSATFLACLELARDGVVELVQRPGFGPVTLKARDPDG